MFLAVNNLIFLERMKEIEIESRQLDEFKLRTQAFGNFDEWIKFNVQGTIFLSSRKVFSVLPICFFTTMLSEAPSGEDKCYLINRDKLLFDVILEYLNGGNASEKIRKIENLDLLQAEADFYGIGNETKFQKLVKDERDSRWTIEPTINGKLEDNGLTLVKTGIVIIIIFALCLYYHIFFQRIMGVMRA